MEYKHSVKHTIAVFSKLHNICLIKLNELCEDAGFDKSCDPCIDDNLNGCIFQLKVNLHHKIEVITCTL